MQPFQFRLLTLFGIQAIVAFVTVLCTLIEAYSFAVFCGISFALLSIFLMWALLYSIAPVATKYFTVLGFCGFFTLSMSVLYIQQAREQARRMECTNKLKQLAIDLQRKEASPLSLSRPDTTALDMWFASMKNSNISPDAIPLNFESLEREEYKEREQFNFKEYEIDLFKLKQSAR